MLNEFIFTLIFLSFKILDLQDNLANLMKDVEQTATHPIQFVIFTKNSSRYGMTGEECKFLHQTPCRKYMENPERRWIAQCRGYNSELCKYPRECYNDRCFRIHPMGTRRKQTPPATHEQSTTPRTTNQEQALITT